jgi:hypothetical protein
MRKSLITAALAIATLFFSATSSHSWTIIQLTDNEYSDRNYQVNSSGQVVWEGYDGHDWEIFVFDGIDPPERATSNSDDDTNPQISDSGWVVWEQNDTAEGDYKIWIGTTSGIAWIYDDRPDYDDRYPDINSDGVVTWQGWDGSHWQIYVHDSAGLHKISTLVYDPPGPGDYTYENAPPQINDMGFIAWEHQTIEGGNPKTKAIGAYYDGDSYFVRPGFLASQIDMSDTNGMVWIGGETSGPLPNREIFGSSDAGVHVHQVTYEASLPYHEFKTHPRINDFSHVVWSGRDADETDYDIFFDRSGIGQLTYNDYDDAHPEIRSDTDDVVWEGYDGNDNEIFFVSSSSNFKNIIQLTRNCRDDTLPLIAGNGDVVWQYNDGNDGEIFLARPYYPGPATHWASTYSGIDEDQADSAQQTSDGGYIVSGSTETFGAGGSDIWMIKLDEAGSVEWETSIGGTDSEYGVSMDIAGRDGLLDGYILAATTTSFGEGEDDIWIAKLDLSGNATWERSVGGPGIDIPGSIIRLDCELGYVVAGKTESFGADSNGDAWIFRLDANGAVEWQKRYGAASGGEHIADIRQTGDDGLIAAGDTHSFGTNGDFWVLKLDALGNVEWQKAYGGSDIDYAVSIRQVGDGGYIVAGNSYSFEVSTASYDVWVLRLDASGDILWQKAYGTIAWDFVTSIDVTADGGFVMTGTTGAADPFAPRDAWVMKLDYTGEIEWQQKYGGVDLTADDSLSSIEQSADGGFIAAGGTEYFGLGGGDFWVLKLDENGEIPGCSAMATWSATSKDTDGTAADTSANVSDTSATPAATTSMTTDTMAIQGDGCELVPADLIDLPKTGQTISYYAADDGALQMGVSWPSGRFINNGDGTMTDSLTGLMWLTDANSANTIGHDPDGTGDGSMLWESALDFVAGINNGTYSISAPHTDWRLPNINEIESLAHWGQGDEAAWFSGQGFDNIQPEYYWSSTTYVRSSTSARCIDMSTGHISTSIKASALLHVWPVRGGQQDYPDTTSPANVWKTGQTTSYYPGDDGDWQMGVFWPIPRFIENGDGTVTDSLTALTWLQDGSCLGAGPWETGHNNIADFNTNPDGFACEGYTADYDDWRMPNRKELFSLIDYSQPSPYPSVPPDHPFTNLSLNWYWTSTTYAPLTPDNPTWAWSIPLDSVSMSYQHKSGASNFWAVRGGEAAIELPAISRNLSTLNNSCPEGQDAPGQSFDVWNSGAGTLSYSISDDADWLSCSPENGTSTGETDTVTVTYATSGLPAGSYAGTITISDPLASNDPQYVAVDLTITPVPTISFYPDSLSTSCSQGTDPFPEGLTVWNSGDGTLFYSISDDAEWLSCSPSTGISTGEADSITITYATSGLSAGSYLATVTVSDPTASNNPQYVPVELTVGPPAGLSHINCLTPTNESVLGSAPTFTWTSIGGTNNRFAVDLSLDWTFTQYWSTYENLHQPLSAQSWAMPATLWNRIPSGTYAYWRVRGADLDVAPLTIITGDDVWWFYKP